MHLISNLRKPAGRRSLPGALVGCSFQKAAPQSLIKGSPVAWLISQVGPFEMRRSRRHRRSMGFFDQLPIMTLGGGP